VILNLCLGREDLVFDVTFRSVLSSVWITYSVEQCHQDQVHLICWRFCQGHRLRSMVHVVVWSITTELLEIISRSQAKVNGPFYCLVNFYWTAGDHFKVRQRVIHPDHIYFVQSVTHECICIQCLLNVNHFLFV